LSPTAKERGRKEKTYLNGTQARDEMIKVGLVLALPTAIDWLMREGFATNPAKRIILVDQAKLQKYLAALTPEDIAQINSQRASLSSNKKRPPAKKRK
jgi:hypothetical protein